MRDPQQRRRRWAGGATILLLALALAGCGGGDAGGNGAAGDSARVAANKSKGPPGGGAPDSCPPPPPVSDSVLRGKWSGLVSYLGSQGVTFPNTPDNTAVRSVPLCITTGCTPVQVRLQSTAQTYCMSGAQASEQRVLGMMVLLQAFSGTPSIPGIAAGDSIFLIARGTPGAQLPAKLVYRTGVDSIVQLPSGKTGWNFVFCNDGHVNDKPKAQWRTAADTMVTTSGADAADAPDAPDAPDASGDGPGG
ncbi:MAG TPA: hypothetical protein VGX50_13240, partial [Longimicrobium sp.]|nr:hypothetical protein [Longimicrobium sp.]